MSSPWAAAGGPYPPGGGAARGVNKLGVKRVVSEDPKVCLKYYMW